MFVPVTVELVFSSVYKQGVLMAGSSCFCYAFTLCYEWKNTNLTKMHYRRRPLCRGLHFGHSAKGVFAEGQPQEPSAKIGPRQRNGPRQNKSLPRARQIWPDGSRRPLASVFAECPPSGTRQRFFIFIF